MRYRLHDHPGFPEPLTKEDLYLLVQRGSLARGDLCRDLDTGRDHVLGEVIGTMRPPRAPGVTARVGRPAFQEIRGDSPFEEEVTALPAGAVESPDEESGIESEIEEGESAADHDAPPAVDELLHFSHPSWFAYLKGLFLGILLLITAALLYQFEGGLFLLALALAAAVFGIIALARISRDYIVTADRVELIWGIIGRNSKEVRIRDIRSIDVYHRGFAGAVLGLGTVDFSSAANAGVEVQFKDTRCANRIKELVRELQREAQRG